jgi:hypothetical protein
MKSPECKTSESSLQKIGMGALEALAGTIPGGSILFFPIKHRKEILDILLPRGKRRLLTEWVILEINNLSKQVVTVHNCRSQTEKSVNDIALEYPPFAEKQRDLNNLSLALPDNRHYSLGKSKTIDLLSNSGRVLTVSVASIQFLCISALRKIDSEMGGLIKLEIGSYMGADQVDGLEEPLPDILILPVTTFAKRVADNLKLQEYQLISTPHFINSTIVYREADVCGSLRMYGLGLGVSEDVITRAGIEIHRNVEKITLKSEEFIEYVGFVNNLDTNELYTGFDPFLVLFLKNGWRFVPQCNISSSMGIFMRNDLSPECAKLGFALARIIHSSLLEISESIRNNPEELKTLAKSLMKEKTFVSRISKLYDSFLI